MSEMKCDMIVSWDKHLKNGNLWRVNVELPMQDAPEDAPRNKRCNNLRLRESGYQLIYPGYRDGYAAMLRDNDSA